MRDSFNDQGIYLKTDQLNISQLLTDEANYNLDISGNLVIGDSIAQVFGSVSLSTTGAEVENLQIIPIDTGTRGEISMVAVWAEKNDLNTYDIRYQKFDNQGNKHGEELLVVSNNSDSVLTNLSTNEFTIDNMGPIVQVNSPSGSQGHLTPFDQNYKGGLQYVQFDDNSYVAVWEEVQDRSNLGIGYQRFDSEGKSPSTTTDKRF